MVMSPVGLGTKNYCAGEGQQQFVSQSVSQSALEIAGPAEQSSPRYWKS
jgi:hypothetical protein